MEKSTKKWMWILGGTTAVVVIGALTKDKWMPFFKKETASTAPTGKPPVANTSSTPDGKEEVKKSGFVPSDLNYPKKVELNYPKGKTKSNFSYSNRSNLDNKPSFDGGRFTMIDITKKQNGEGFDFRKAGFSGSSELDNDPF